MLKLLIAVLMVSVVVGCSKKADTIVGKWKKTISPTLAKYVDAEMLDSLENTTLFNIKYSFEPDSSFKIETKINDKYQVLESGTFKHIADSTLQLSFVKNQTITYKEFTQFSLSSPDTLVIVSENGLNSYLVRL